MIVEELSYPSATGVSDIYAQIWAPKENPAAILQISHGMAEHIARYDAFAQYMAGRSILVAANDHAGHGKSIRYIEDLGYFGQENGWSNVVTDMQTLHDTLVKRYKNIPYIMMGHSMGSLLTRSYATSYGKNEEIAAYIFSGTMGTNPAIGIGKLIAQIEKKRNGTGKPSALLHSLSFGMYNKPFHPSRTEVDWLSSDTDEVDKYVSDPLCGFQFTAEAMSDMFDGLKEINGEAWAVHVNDVPILLISGELDPVGGKGAKGVKQVEKWLKNTGHKVTCKLYPQGRHEMLNETNKLNVYEDIYTFIHDVALNMI